jgi:hypothetical protein
MEGKRVPAKAPPPQPAKALPPQRSNAPQRRPRMPATSIVDDPVSLNERRLAAAVHVGSIAAPIVVPGVAWVIGQRSPFIKGHAQKALIDFLLLKVALFVAIVASSIYTISRLITLYQNDWKGFDVTEFLIRFVVGWALLAILGAITTICSLREAWQAYNGKWPRRFAKRPR